MLWERDVTSIRHKLSGWLFRKINFDPNGRLTFFLAKLCGNIWVQWAVWKNIFCLQVTATKICISGHMKVKSSQIKLQWYISCKTLSVCFSRSYKQRGACADVTMAWLYSFNPCQAWALRKSALVLVSLRSRAYKTQKRHLVNTKGCST